MKLSEHFDSSEFSCPCCGLNKTPPELVKVLEELRTTYDKPVHINSSTRCPKHNKEVGGVEDSQHVKGTAADITVEGMSPAKVYQYFQYKYPNKYGLGLYKTFVHVDVRPTKARWVK